MANTIENLSETAKEAVESVIEEVDEAGKEVAKIFKKEAKVLGPGLITGVSDDDPSGVIMYTATGAQFGYKMSWLTLFTLPLMTAIQEMCARIGMVTGKGLAGVTKKHYGKWMVYISVSLLVIANTINIGADLGAMAAVAKLVFGGEFVLYILFFTILTLFLEIFISYKVYSKYLKWLAFSLLSYFVTAFIVKHDISSLIHGISSPFFTFDKIVLMTVVGFLGTTISPYLFFWQAGEEVEEAIKEKKIIAFGWGLPRINWRQIKLMRKDVLTGMILSNLAAYFIIITAAATLYPAGVTSIETASDAASALKPLAGNFASILFALGIIGTGLLGVPVLAGSAAYAVSETFGWKEGLYRKVTQAHGFYGVITFATLIGLGINFVGISPMKALYYAAIANGIASPFLIFVILLICNNKKIMGNKSNGIWSNIFGIFTLIFMSSAAIALFIFWG